MSSAASLIRGDSKSGFKEWIQREDSSGIKQLKRGNKLPIQLSR